MARVGLGLGLGLGLGWALGSGLGLRIALASGVFGARALGNKLLAGGHLGARGWRSAFSDLRSRPPNTEIG